MTSRWQPIAVAALAALSVATLGGLMTDIGPWYLALEQPAWKPPDWAFGPIWTMIFALCAAAGVIGWRQAAVSPMSTPTPPSIPSAAPPVTRNASASGSSGAIRPDAIDTVRRGTRKRRREWMLVLFAANGFLNVFWSLLFFALRRPDWSIVEVPFLWLSVLALIVWLARYARRAAWLLAPYIAWVTLAAVLNWQTVALNGPFAGR